MTQQMFSFVCWDGLCGLRLHSDVVRFTGPKGEHYMYVIMSVLFSACRCQPVTSVDRGPVLVLLHIVWVLASVGSNRLHTYGHFMCAQLCRRM